MSFISQFNLILTKSWFLSWINFHFAFSILTKLPIKISSVTENGFNENVVLCWFWAKYVASLAKFYSVNGIHILYLIYLNACFGRARIFLLFCQMAFFVCSFGVLLFFCRGVSISQKITTCTMVHARSKRAVLFVCAIILCVIAIPETFANRFISNIFVSHLLWIQRVLVLNALSFALTKSNQASVWIFVHRTNLSETQEMAKMRCERVTQRERESSRGESWLDCTHFVSFFGRKINA